MRRGRAKVAERNRDESAHRPEDLLAFRRTAMIKEAGASTERGEEGAGSGSNDYSKHRCSNIRYLRISSTEQFQFPRVLPAQPGLRTYT